MSEKSTKTETLSINSTVCMETDDPKMINSFLDDLKELYAEWQDRVQITTLNLSVHDRRKYVDIFQPSEAKQFEINGSSVAVRQGLSEEDPK